MAKGDVIGKGKETQFTSENQPSGEAKSKGKQKKKLLKDIAEMVVTGGLVEDLKPLAKKLGLDPNVIDIETMMHLRQIEKAVQDGDTSAYNSVMDRLKGKPKQAIDHTTDGKALANEKIEVVFKDFSDEA